MKITESQLRRMIRHELELIEEGPLKDRFKRYARNAALAGAGIASGFGGVSDAGAKPLTPADIENFESEEAPLTPEEIKAFEREEANGTLAVPETWDEVFGLQGLKPSDRNYDKKIAIMLEVLNSNEYDRLGEDEDDDLTIINKDSELANLAKIAEKAYFKNDAIGQRELESKLTDEDTIEADYGFMLEEAFKKVLDGNSENTVRVLVRIFSAVYYGETVSEKYSPTEVKVVKLLTRHLK